MPLIAPSRRITSPLSIRFSTLCTARGAEALGISHAVGIAEAGVHVVSSAQRVLLIPGTSSVAHFEENVTIPDIELHADFTP